MVLQTSEGSERGIYGLLDLQKISILPRIFRVFHSIHLRSQIRSFKNQMGLIKGVGEDADPLTIASSHLHRRVHKITYIITFLV